MLTVHFLIHKALQSSVDQNPKYNLNWATKQYFVNPKKGRKRKTEPNILGANRKQITNWYFNHKSTLDVNELHILIKRPRLSDQIKDDDPRSMLFNKIRSTYGSQS